MEVISEVKYNLKVVEESDIDWRLQNRIHELLNIAYEGLTNQFISKTYAYMRPEQRILVFDNGELVGHCGLIENEITNLPTGSLRVGGIGLMASRAKSAICRMFLQKAIDIHAANGLPMSIGYSSNLSVIRCIFSKMNSYVVDIPTIGTSSCTKPVDKTVIFPSSPSVDMNIMLSLPEIRLAKEIF